jgi:hypothetical protein
MVSNTYTFEGVTIVKLNHVKKKTHHGVESLLTCPLYLISTKGWLMSLNAYIIQDDIVNPIDLLTRDPSFCLSRVLDFIV